MKSVKTRMMITACAATLAAGAIAGCGGGSSPAPVASSPSGNVVQGPVSGALVFADSLTSGVRYVRDATEVYTFTDPNGKFTFPSTPAYDYVVVSQKGTDTITNREAMQLVAPKEARNVSALTTLVALTPAAEQAALKTKLEALGVKYDDDISKTVTSAALLLIKSVETTIDALTKSIDKNSALPDSVVNDIQAQVVKAIATQLSSANLTDTANLKTTLTSSITTALDQSLPTIDSKYSSIINLGTDIEMSTMATNLASAVVNSVSDAVGTSLSTATPTSEATFISANDVSAMVSVINSTADQIDNTITTSTDSAPPEVAGTNHANSAVNVNLTTTLQARFNEAIDPATITTVTVTLKAGATPIAGSIIYDPMTLTVIFTPTTPLASNTAHTFTLTTGIKDVSGNALASSHIVNFTTINTATTGSTGSTGSTNF